MSARTSGAGLSRGSRLCCASGRRGSRVRIPHQIMVPVGNACALNCVRKSVELLLLLLGGMGSNVEAQCKCRLPTHGQQDTHFVSSWQSGHGGLWSKYLALAMFSIPSVLCGAGSRNKNKRGKHISLIFDSQTTPRLVHKNNQGCRTQKPALVARKTPGQASRRSHVLEPSLVSNGCPAGAWE